jgi:hypothetical protein
MANDTMNRAQKFPEFLRLEQAQFKLTRDGFEKRFGV